MKWILSRYNHDISYLPEYTDDYVLYDRSEEPIEGSIVVKNVGSDWYDKLTYIIDNYDNLPDIAVYTKANIFKYLDRDELEPLLKADKFTPILSQRHQSSVIGNQPFAFYCNGIYWELNNLWYTNSHPLKHDPIELMSLLGTVSMAYVPFAPGSNYILTKQDILKHPKELYVKIRSYLDWAVYPGEAMIVERGMYTLWS